jgi:leucyl-tRNA synthetase
LPEWPEAVKLQQANWIGKSVGAEIEFRIVGPASGGPQTTDNGQPVAGPTGGATQSIKVFTTRPDTIFGATYMVVAPEHPLVQKLENRIQNLKEVKKYIEKAKEETEIQRTSADKDKTGVELKESRR